MLWYLWGLSINLCLYCSTYDLYTKSSKVPDIEALKPYYQGLIDKYIPGVVKF